MTSAPGDTTPSFSGAATAGGATGVPASGVSYFHFAANKTGDYALASTAPGRASREWVKLEVGASNSTPELVLDGVTYAVNIQSGGGGSGGGLGQ